MENSITRTSSITRKRKLKKPVETIMNVIFLICGLAAVVSVILISLYMVFSGAPAIAKIGPLKFLAGQIWNPEVNDFGILPLILSSVTATGLAILIAVPAALCAAIFLTHIAKKRVATVLLFLVELLAGIPSVVYGLLGAILIVPLVFKAQTALGMPMSGSLLSASIVLVIMILPTIISVSVASINTVPKQYNDVSLALGSSKMQSIMRAIIPAAKSGIVSGIVLGVGRAIGETMAVMMVAGNAPIMPELLKPARLLTVGISMEWAYSSGLHRDALYGIGLVLFVFIMIINILLSSILKKGNNTGNK
ncbi:phosphate transport system permease protein [Clostridia bacterium]|nr:phosphate transport system permease protein [Clostridia bacterium]